MKLSFNDLRTKSQPVEKRWTGTLLSLDPGHTTGYSLWEVTTDKVTMIDANQLLTWKDDDIRLNTFNGLLHKYEIDHVIYESYQVYDWKVKDHSWSQVPTLQVIGGIKILLQQRIISYSSQTAQVAKQFCTDEKLEQWGFYREGLRHARDAIRHGCYFLLFRP